VTGRPSGDVRAAVEGVAWTAAKSLAAVALSDTGRRSLSAASLA
jgi:hypothetical protein